MPFRLRHLSSKERAAAGRCGALLSCLLLLWGACGEDLPKRAEIIDPVFGEPCLRATCSDHGECAAAEDGSPVCLCEAGYAGGACQNCEPGFHRDFLGRCAPDDSCAEQQTNPCGLNGSCDDRTGIIECHCDPGYVGPRCDLCASGWARNEYDECLQLVLAPPEAPPPPPPPVCEADSCAGHGRCQQQGGSLQCSCDLGYAGTRCATCAVGYRRDLAERCVPTETCTAGLCGPHGECDDATGEAVCTCDRGYAGSRCQRCAPGFHEEDGKGCMLDQECLPTTCGGGGTCTQNQGVITCVCSAGYEGDRCELCAEGYHRDDAQCVVNEVCGAGECGAHGQCNDSTGVIFCACDPGYTGDRCDACATGFHLGQDGTCVLDEQCQTNSCPPTASCDDSSGEIECMCKEGYAGDRCERCAQGYYRDHARNRCVLFNCQNNPIPAPGAVNWDNRTSFPKYENNCVSGLSLDHQDVSFRSLGGDGIAWACGVNTLYGLTTNHIFLEAGTQSTAQLVFSGPVERVTFEYGARSALNLAIEADGVVVDTLSAPRRMRGSLSYTFEAPITVLAFRSTVGGIAGLNQIAIDNITFAPPMCQ